MTCCAIHFVRSKSTEGARALCVREPSVSVAFRD